MSSLWTALADPVTRLLDGVPTAEQRKAVKVREGGGEGGETGGGAGEKGGLVVRAIWRRPAGLGTRAPSSNV